MRNNYSYLCGDELDMDTVLLRIDEELLKASLDFNLQKIKAHDISRIHNTINKHDWLEKTKSLRWFGPYSLEKKPQKETIFFQT